LEAEGEFALVRQILEPTLATPSEWIGDHDLYAVLADVAARQRDQAALRLYAPRAAALARRYDHRLYEAIALRALGVSQRLAEEFESADHCLNQALTQFQQLGTRWQIGRTLTELAELAAAQANPPLARDFLTQALAAFEEMGAMPDVRRVQASLSRQ